MIITGIGAAIGALVRYNLTAFIKGKLGTNFPIATLIINLTGAFLFEFLFYLRNLSINAVNFPGFSLSRERA